MVRGSRTPPQPHPMIAARVDEKGRKWGKGRSAHPLSHCFPFPLELAPGIWDLDLAQSGKGLLRADSVDQMFAVSASRGETRGRQKRGLDVPPSWYVACAGRFQKTVAF